MNRSLGFYDCSEGHILDQSIHRFTWRGANCMVVVAIGLPRLIRAAARIFLAFKNLDLNSLH